MTGWTSATITDPTYRAKFIGLPDIIRDWVAPVGGLAGKDVLDFGCGEATTALGIALRDQPNRVVGIDILANFTDCAPLAAEQIGLPGLPENLHFARVEPGFLHDAGDRFDVIYSWSVFEHVDQSLLAHTFELLRQALKPGGVLFIQIAPLFYSANGAHLEQWIAEPWAHLRTQHSVYLERLAAACPDPVAFHSLEVLFETLNRLTASQLVAAAEAGGFKVLREYREAADGPIPADLAEIYQPEVLQTFQVVLLLQAV